MYGPSSTEATKAPYLFCSGERLLVVPVKQYTRRQRKLAAERTKEACPSLTWNARRGWWEAPLEEAADVYHALREAWEIGPSCSNGALDALREAGVEWAPGLGWAEERIREFFATRS